MNRTLQGIRILLIALVTGGLLLFGGTSETRAAGLLIAEGGLGGRLEIEEQMVDVTIDNGIAVTHVSQVFRNQEDRIVEALYTFPVPEGASVANFSMWIGGKEVVGEVVEKERAREIYNSYKRVQRDPGLLEQVDFKSFEMRIFPIAARAEQRVQITYYQELEWDADWATYVYPLATTTRSAMDSTIQGRFGLTLEIESEVPIVGAESPSHPDEFAFASEKDQRTVRASYEIAAGDLSRDLVIAFQTRRPMSGMDLIASKQPGEDGFFLLTLTAGDELGASRDKGMDYAFLLDISGSMDDAGKLGLSRGSLDAFVKALSKKDRFDIITFNAGANSLFNRLQEVNEGTQRQANDFLNAQRAKGGTFLEPALREAFTRKDPDRPLNVVILSDGMTEIRERQTLLRLSRERPSSTRIFAIGVGNDVNRPLLEQLAEQAGGLAAFVSRGDNFTRAAKSFRRKLLRPIASDLKMTFEGGGLYDLEPMQAPSLFHGAPVRWYGRYRNPGEAKIVLRGNIGGEPFERVLELDLPGDEAERPEIERMWARKRIDRLMKQIDRDGTRTDWVDEIVNLGEGFSIVSEYTSFLVLENDAEYQRWKIERRNGRRIQRDRDAQRRSRDRLSKMRSKSLDIGPVEEVEPAPELARNTPGPTRPSPRPTRSSSPSTRSMDFGLGGGAIDPFSALLAAGLAAGAWGARRRRKS